MLIQGSLIMNFTKHLFSILKKFGFSRLIGSGFTTSQGRLINSTHPLILEDELAPKSINSRNRISFPDRKLKVKT